MYMLFVYAHNMLSSLITLTRSRLLGINNTCRDTYTQLKFCASNALFCCIYMGLAEIYTMCVSACVRVDVNVWGIFFLWIFYERMARDLICWNFVTRGRPTWQHGQLCIYLRNVVTPDVFGPSLAPVYLRQRQIWLPGIPARAQPNGGRWQVLRLNCHLRRCGRFCCSFLGKFGMRGMEESSDTKSPRS